jgi:hypothetical protein
MTAGLFAQPGLRPAFPRETMPRKRPTAVFTIAVLHLVGGGLGLLAGVCGGFILALRANAVNNGTGDTMTEYLDANVPSLQAVMMLDLGVDVLLSLLLLVAGLGLLSMQLWARGLTVFYAILSIGHKIGYVVFQIGFVFPVLNEFLRQGVGTQANSGAYAVGARAGFLMRVFFFTFLGLYPVVALCVLFSRRVSDAFLQTGRRFVECDDEEDDDYDDEDWDDRFRRRRFRERY